MHTLWTCLIPELYTYCLGGCPVVYILRWGCLPPPRVVFLRTWVVDNQRIYFMDLCMIQYKATSTLVVQEIFEAHIFKQCNFAQVWTQLNHYTFQLSSYWIWTAIMLYHMMFKFLICLTFYNNYCTLYLLLNCL